MTITIGTEAIAPSRRRGTDKVRIRVVKIFFDNSILAEDPDGKLARYFASDLEEVEV